MDAELPNRGLRITSMLSAAGAVELELAEIPIAQPGPGQVVVRVEAAPINPSDLIALLAFADPAQARFAGTPSRPRVTACPSPETARLHALRIGQRQPVGLEGAGVVVAAGRNAGPLLGRTVTLLSLARGSWAQYCTVSTAECMVLPEGTTATEGAAAFVNPLTALAMVETMRLEGHKALIHTAAASNLGRMLVKICREDGIPLVNIVRRQEQVELLRTLGAKYVCNSSAQSIRADLIQAVSETGATIAFDAIAGGSIVSEILSAIEAVAASRLTEYSPYGSFQPKQVYIYGLLDSSPTVLTHDYGVLWGVGAWFMPAIMERVGPERAAALRQRVLSSLKTTFASHYTRTISLAQALQRDVMIAYTRKATGEKYLINPQL